MSSVARTPSAQADLPTTIRVGAVEYTVDATPAGWAGSCAESGKSAGDLGRTHALTSRIFVNPSQSPSNHRLTLLHEAMHAMCESALGSPDWHGLGKNPAAREETVIRTWEAPLLNLMRDNPELVSYLTSTDT